MKLGVHISSAAPFSETITRAKEADCECMQIFVNPPQRWNPVVISEQEIKKYIESNKSAKIKPVVIHGIYLINLATNNPYFYQASINSLIDDMKKAKQIGALGVNFHVGSTKGADFNDVLDKIAEAINKVLAEVPEGPDLILENSAGAGNIIGDKFEELAAIINKVNSKRLKVTLDTAHAFESGYDISTEEGLEKTLNEFNNKIGLDRLVCLHLNDSATPLGSNRDRHENIGHGHIGKDAFERIVNHPKLKDLPGILETPDLKGRSIINNLQILKDLRK